jgi:hypothetical protein
MLADGSIDPTTLPALVTLQEAAVERVTKAPKLGPIEAADAEEQIGGWLEDHGLDDGWELAPTLVDGGLDPRMLDRAVGRWPRASVGLAVRWLANVIETESLMDEIEDATTRVSALVGAAKQYSQMDRAPFHEVDVHELLDSTLVMMRQKLGDDIAVVKAYDRSLPPLPAYAAELNQVWTNLVDNAVDAMGGRGRLVVRTYGRTTTRWSRSPHRGRDPARCPDPHLRAVLHHEARRRGHRARPGHLLADRGQQAPRRHPRHLRAGQHPLPGLPPLDAEPQKPD